MLISNVLLLFIAGFIGKRSSDALWISQNPTVRHYFPSIEYRPHIYSAPVSNGIRPEESCTSSEECAGFPQAFCDGVCRCIIGAFNAGSACVKPVFHDSSSQRSCPTQQVYVSEAGMCMAVRKPDEGCEYSEQCSAVERGAYCFNRRCRCMLGMIASAAKCVYPSERCTSNGYVWIQETDECKPIIPPGMPGCGYNLQCSAAFDGAKCSKQMCQCPNELVPSGNTCIQRCQSGQVYSVAAGQCLPTVRAGGSCHYSIQCNAELPELICEERVCRCSNSERFTGSTCRSDCPRGYRADQYGICKPEISDRLEAAPTESCARGEICKGGSTCRQGICQCPHGSQPVNSECFPQSAGLPTAGPGAPCIPNVVQCTDGTSCIAGVCRCAMGAELRNGACSGSTTSLLASPGEPCQRGQHCDGGATCDEHTLTCVCPSDKIRIGKQCYDRLRSGPGLPCGNGELCVGGSICINNICQCRVDQIKDGRQCIMMPKVGPEESCARGEECIGGSKCDQFTRRCKCPLKHLIIRKECVAIEYVHPGEPCSRKNQRCIELSSCVLGRCRCDDDHTAFNGKCVRNGQTYPGEPCSEDVQCSGRASCMKGICTCPAEYVIINKECHRVEIVGPDEVCGGVRQCGGGSKCDESEAKCRCASGYQPHRGVCRLIVTAPECLSDVECSSGFICDRGQCRCPQGSQPTPSGTCVTLQRAQPSVVERNSCDENTRCHGELICIRNICTCPYPLVVASGNRCLPRALGQMRDAPYIPSRGQTHNHVAKGHPNRPLVIRVKAETLQRCPRDGSCRLPKCFCSQSGMEIPNQLSPSEVPQMVLLTFNDPITDQSIKIFKSVFDGRFRNPNGCPVKATFFVSHEWNNYDQTQWLRSRGHEIAVNSFSAENLTVASPSRWHQELNGMKEALRQFSYIRKDDIIGFRAPYLSLGGENQFAAMVRNGFRFESTMRTNGQPYWPQTLGYSVAWNCSGMGCPRKPYPSIWEIPIGSIEVVAGDQKPRSIVDIIQSKDTSESVATRLFNSFLRYYNYNRAPFVLEMDKRFLEALPEGGAVIAVEKFLEKVLNVSDVYVVSASQLIAWMETPARLTKIHNFNAWKCSNPYENYFRPCENPSTCAFTCERGESHAFRVCGSCPRAYPVLGDPLGSGHHTRIH